MALPSSGPISLAQIQGTFGGGNPISLSEYYRGGPYTTTHCGNLAIPTGGTIRLSNFYGAYRGYKPGNSYLALDFNRTYFNNFGYSTGSFAQVIYATMDKGGTVRARFMAIPRDQNPITRAAIARNGTILATWSVGSFAAGCQEITYDLTVCGGDRVELWMGAGTGVPGSAYLKLFGIKHDGGEVAGSVPLTFVGQTTDQYIATCV